MREPLGFTQDLANKPRFSDGEGRSVPEHEQKRFEHALNRRLLLFDRGLKRKGNLFRSELSIAPIRYKPRAQVVDNGPVNRLTYTPLEVSKDRPRPTPEMNTIKVS